MTVPMPFEVQELWFIHQALPHEETSYIPDHVAPVLTNLHQQVGDGLAFCYETEEDEATLLLDDASCGLIQSMITPMMFDSLGTPVGRNILLKSFRASHAIRNGEFPLAKEDGLDYLTREQTQRLLAFKELPDSYGDTPLLH